MQAVKIFKNAAIAVVLTLAPLAGAQPAAAAPGFHAAFFSESAFLTLSPGQTGQFSVGYTNTGDQPWVKGKTAQEASLHTASPLDNPLDFTAGWAVGWAAANIYAKQANDLVAPGQVGFFVYSVKVPAAQGFGTKIFYGRPAIDGVGLMEDYGYYQVVTIAGAVAITSVSPTSPSTNNKPTLNGNGAGVSEIVTITDGASGPTVGTATADVNGVWSTTLTSSLTAGTHTLFASTLTKGQSSGSFYTVSPTTGPVIVNAYATTLTSLTVTFSDVIKCASATGRNDLLNINNYFVNLTLTGALGPTISSVVASTDCTQATITLASSLTVGKSYALIGYFFQNGSGSTLDPSGNTAAFSIGAPSLSAWEGKQDGNLTLTFNSSMSTSGGTTGSFSVLNPSNYTVDAVTAATTTTVTCIVSSLNGCLSVRLLFTGGSGLSVLGATGTVHTVGILNVTDAISGGQTITPNPTSRQIATIS